MKILIIEPHGDDALCSLSHVLADKNKEITLYTMGVSRSSEKLKEYYPNIKDYKYFELPEIHFSNVKHLLNTHVFNGIYKDAGPIECYAHYVDKMSKFMEYTDVVNPLRDILKEISYNKFHAVYIPVGLKHPYHYVLAKLAEIYAPEFKVIYYADKPYIQTRMMDQILEGWLYSKGFSKSNIHYVPTHGESVKDLLFKVYPTERGMLRFSSKVLLEDANVEIYY